MISLKKWKNFSYFQLWRQGIIKGKKLTRIKMRVSYSYVYKTIDRDAPRPALAG
jgi:hypothetical protein